MLILNKWFNVKFFGKEEVKMEMHKEVKEREMEQIRQEKRARQDRLLKNRTERALNIARACHRPESIDLDLAANNIFDAILAVELARQLKELYESEERFELL